MRRTPRRPRPLRSRVVRSLAVGVVLAMVVGTIGAALLLREVTSEWGALTIRLVILWSLLSGSLLWFAGRTVSRDVAPLAMLTEAARKVSEDDEGPSAVEPTGAAEVAELAEAFNSMTRSLQDRRDALTHRVLELTTLYEMSRSLGSTLDTDVLVRTVLETAVRVFDVERGYVALLDGQGVLELRAERGPEIRSDERTLRGSMADWVVRHGRPLVFNPAPAAETQIEPVTGSIAALCVPLSSAQGTVGALTVGTADVLMRFSTEDVRLLATIANQASIALGNIELFSSLQEAYLATVRSLAAAVDAKDRFTRGHSDRVAAYAQLVGEEMELSADQKTALEMAAYLHDIGKIGVRGEILLKPGALDDEERGQMRHHPLIGANILKPVTFPWPIVPIIRHHHEAWDGTGYPAGLAGHDIPLPARILTVSDSYEAMTSDRPYRRGMTPDEAIGELKRCSGTQFDPLVVDAFLRALEAHGPVRRYAVHPAEIGPDEARAVFIGVFEGMVDGFARLGGPRLASNLEVELEAAFRDRGEPFSLREGRLEVAWEAVPPAEELQLMRAVLKRLARSMERFTGPGLTEGFYLEAVASLPDHLRLRAVSLALLTPRDRPRRWPAASA